MNYNIFNITFVFYLHFTFYLHSSHFIHLHFTFYISFTYISTRSTLTPQGSVASSRVVSIQWEISSRSESISAKHLVPNTFLKHFGDTSITANDLQIGQYVFFIILTYKLSAFKKNQTIDKLCLQLFSKSSVSG